MLTLSQLLGFPHYDYLLAELTAKQLQDWRIWLRRFVPTPNRHDNYFAMLTACICNAFRSKNAKPRSPKDFLLYEPDELEEYDISAEDLAAKLGIKR